MTRGGGAAGIRVKEKYLNKNSLCFIVSDNVSIFQQLGDFTQEEILAHRLEEISRIAVPGFYFLFNLIFWCLAVMT